MIMKFKTAVFAAAFMSTCAFLAPATASAAGYKGCDQGPTWWVAGHCLPAPKIGEGYVEPRPAKRYIGCDQGPTWWVAGHCLPAPRVGEGYVEPRPSKHYIGCDQGPTWWVAGHCLPAPKVGPRD